MLQSVVVDGDDVLVSAKEASQISLAKLEARETAAKAKAKREEERVKELKKVRGEKWLPSIARQMKVHFLPGVTRIASPESRVQICVLPHVTQVL